MAAIASTYKVKVGNGGSLDQSFTYRRKAVSMDDGYEQRTRVAINNIKRSWSITFTDLTTTQKDTLIGILNTAGGVDALDWVAPGDSIARKWLVTDSKVKYYDGIFWEISASMSELSEAG
jgi:phage-related protein